MLPTGAYIPVYSFNVPSETDTRLPRDRMQANKAAIGVTRHLICNFSITIRISVKLRGDVNPSHTIIAKAVLVRRCPVTFVRSALRCDAEEPVFLIHVCLITGADVICARVPAA